MAKRRVFITGRGSVSPFDTDAGGGFAEALFAPGQARGDTCGGRVGIDLVGAVATPSARRMDRFTLLAYLSVRRALSDAALDIDESQRERSGLIFNTCYGPLDSTRRYTAKLIRDGARKVPAAVFPNTVHNAFSGLITIDIKAHGTSSTVSGSNPLCYALDMIREGRDDIVIVGGCDELIDVVQNGFQPFDAGSGRPEASVFGRDRDAMRMGEGAAAIVLESEDSARARGARILAEVLDYGMTNGLGELVDAFPADAEGFAVAMGQALSRSGVAADGVAHVAAAANGLRSVAAAEADAIDSVFGARPPLISAARGLLGETLGAASTFAAIAAVEALQHGRVPATHALRPGVLPAHYVAGDAVPATPGVVLVNAIELGGNFTSLVLAPPPASASASASTPQGVAA